MDYRINQTPKGTLKYPLHSHKNYEIMLYTEGEGFLRTKTENVPFRRGTILIVPPNMIHGSASHQGFRNISIEGEFEGYLHTDTVRSVSDNEEREGETLARLIYENRYKSPAYLASLCTAFLCFLLQRLRVEHPLAQSVQRILSEIAERALDPEIDLGQILRQSGYAEDYIRAELKRITGKTPTKLLTDIRIRHACFLIDVYQGELSLAEIAEKCGYWDYVYFSKQFKTVTGISPRAYRQR